LLGIKENDIHLTIIEAKSNQHIKIIKNESKKNILELEIEKKTYIKNLIGLIIFVIILCTIRSIVVAGILGLILFIFLNPIKIGNSKREPSLSTYLHRIDAKLIYFFVILFLIVHFMEVAELTIILENLIENLTQQNTFLLAIGILIITSILSGLMDDAPITILFLPIIADIIATNQYISNPIFMAFTLGINLGGNFLPQGAACDMMTLELASCWWIFCNRTHLTRNRIYLPLFIDFLKYRQFFHIIYYLFSRNCNYPIDSNLFCTQNVFLIIINK